MNKGAGEKKSGGLYRFLFSRHRTATLHAITTLLAILIALALALILIFAVSKDPGGAIWQFLIGPFSSKRQLGNILTTAATISLVLVFPTLPVIPMTGISSWRR